MVEAMSLPREWMFYCCSISIYVFTNHAGIAVSISECLIASAKFKLSSYIKILNPVWSCHFLRHCSCGRHTCGWAEPNSIQVFYFIRTDWADMLTSSHFLLLHHISARKKIKMLNQNLFILHACRPIVGPS